MEVLLTEDVVGLGDIGERVKVKPGYARNYLIPRGLAVESGATNARAIAHKMRQVEAKKARLKVDAQQEADRLKQVSVEMPIRVGSGGKVFGSVTARNISEKLAEQGIEIDRRRILLTEPIKKLGTIPVRVKLHADVITQISVVVVSTAATEEEEQLETQAAQAALEAAAEKRAAETGDDSAEDFDEEVELDADEEEAAAE